MEKMMFDAQVIKRIADMYGVDYILRQLAEEAAELTQAALKLVRSKNGETPVTVDCAMEQLMEEIADVFLMTECVKSTMMNSENVKHISDIADKKFTRMEKRLLENHK